MTGFLTFAMFVLVLGTARYAFGPLIDRLRWLVDASLRIALIAAAWGIAVMGLCAALDLKSSVQLEVIAVAPILSLLLLLIGIAVYEAPAYWVGTVKWALGILSRRQ